MSKVQSWGRLSNDDHQNVSFHSINHVIRDLKHFLPGVVHGMGRSYGDVALNTNGSLWRSGLLDHMISFDTKSGILNCESGVTLLDIQRTLIPQGWMLPVTPGTQMVTVGGAICNDVHGKNHHIFGSFGDHVLAFKLLRTNGGIFNCSRNENSDWFYATLGGIGLTGFILQVTLQLRSVESAYIRSETIPFYNLEEFFQLSSESEKNWEYNVSWLDCVTGDTAKGLFIRGQHSQEKNLKLPKTKDRDFPFTPSSSLINQISLPLFNMVYFYTNTFKADVRLVHYEPFFYPLDKIHHWNRMYGSKGFYQYQSLVPKDTGYDATREMLRVIKKSGQGSFLSVLKTFGDRESGGLLSFPMQGVTLALDFPNRDQKTLKLFESLDCIVREAKGRLYLAKDARMPVELFQSGYPQFQHLLKYKDPGISSNMSRRLLGE